ncbi:hypothetical protein TRVA0_008S02058 [Trichomonascus vanleenenianus]|uniref:uncharacterized protein n=1 Tax=Trichomonascus vanleenenianus TaxID=2268995 RepID=UPI003ECB414C
MLLAAKVKSVLSGDTVVLTPLNKPDQERVLALAYVSAPRTAEPYGFQSREYLRTLLVGKQIKFKVLYEVNGREYGDIIAPVFPSLLEKALGDGNCKLRDDAAGKSGFEEYGESLEGAQSGAQKASKGVWASSLPPVPTVETSLPKWAMGKQYEAIVEKVISGDRIQIRSIMDRVQYVGPALIAGIRAPRSESPDQPAEPFGETSKQFVTARLLQRNVKAKFIDHSSSGIPIVELSHPAGDIASLILNSGLAQVADWQSQFLGPQRMGVLRQAELVAKNGKLNLWKDSTAPQPQGNKNSFEAVVAKVVSTDTFVVRKQNDEEVTVQLASVRAPKKDSHGPFVPLAREFARSKYIAKKVQVTIEAIRPASEQFDERPLVTMTLNGLNIALQIVAEGWATVVRHRKDDQDRSPVWDELLERENHAISGGKGMHSNKVPPPDRTVDASETVTKARGFFTSLQRQSKIPAIVEHVSSGGRLRLNVPKENCTLTVVLSGVKVPRPNERFGEEALDFVRKRLLQRDVHFNVLGVDKTGAFIGHIFLPGKNIPLSLGLVAEGLAEVHSGAARQSGYEDQLHEAQQKAQQVKKGMWIHYEPVPEREIPEATSHVSPAAIPSRNYFDVVVTSVSPTGQLGYQLKYDVQKHAKLLAELSSYNNAAANSASFTLKNVKRGDNVTIVKNNNEYARGKVLSFDKDSQVYSVQNVDTTEVFSLPARRLRALAPQFTSMAALGKTAQLSFIEVPPNEYAEDFVANLTQNILKKDLVANIDSPASVSPPHITLYTEDSQGPTDSVNSRLIDEGFVYLKTKPEVWEQSEALQSIISGLKDLEIDAKSDRVGIWEYGDPRDLE